MGIKERILQKLNEQERYPDDLESIVMRDQLIRAVEEGDIKQVKMLISAGADVNARDEDGWTPLYWAAYWGHENIVKFLISAGADVNAKNNRGRTPLHWAANKDVAEILKKHGAKK